MSTATPKAVLSKKSINAIAAQVETRLKQNTSTAPSAASTKQAENNTHGNSNKLFFWGAASGVAVALTAPLFGKQARPAMRGVIKGGLVAGRYVQRVAAGIKEDIQDLAAEAKSDLDIEKEKAATAETI